jgi:hypothetical protein
LTVSTHLAEGSAHQVGIKAINDALLVGPADYPGSSLPNRAHDHG